MWTAASRQRGQDAIRAVRAAKGVESKPAPARNAFDTLLDDAPSESHRAGLVVAQPAANSKVLDIVGAMVKDAGQVPLIFDEDDGRIPDERPYWIWHNAALTIMQRYAKQLKGAAHESR
jgi:hypothetical protein